MVGHSATCQADAGITVGLRRIAGRKEHDDRALKRLSRPDRKWAPIGRLTEHCTNGSLGERARGPTPIVYS